MISRWYEYKERAIQLRKRGVSVRDIESQLGVPRSTLSGWFKFVVLSKKQALFLENSRRQGLAKAREKAARVHIAAKKARIQEAARQAQATLENLKELNIEVLEVAFAMLYIGEGFKTTSQTGMANTDPLLLRFFIAIVTKVYNIGISRIKCELHLRADQDIAEIKAYWARELGVAKSNFTTISVDKRTVGSPTYASYKGVCVVRCGSTAVQRRVISLGKLFAKKVSSALMGG